MIIKRTKIVDNGGFASAISGRESTLMKQIMNTHMNTHMNTKANIEMKNKNKLSEENNHACF